MPAGLSYHEAGKAAGVSHTAIGKAVRSRRLSALPDGSIASDALEVWQKNRRAPRGGNHRPETPAVSSVDGDVARKARAALEVTLSPNGVFVDRAAAELARDSFVARLKELEFQEKQGELLNADLVERFISTGLMTLRSKFLSVPSENAPAIARLKTAAEVQDYLHKIIVEYLEELSEYFAAGIK